MMNWRQLDKVVGFVRGESPEKIAERIATREKLIGFDWKFYVNFYPDLVRNGINSKKTARQHWLSYGHSEGRVSGFKCLTFQKNLRRLEAYIQSAAVSNRGDNAGAVQSGPLINILTRSNNRPRFFSDNRSSVTSQTYRRYRQLVSYENNDTLEYLQKAGVPHADMVKVVKGGSNGTHPYNLFNNDLMDRVTEGWVMFLDDDDVLTTPHALATIASHLTGENRLIIWKSWFPDKIVPRHSIIQELKEGNLTSNSFAFHSRHKKIARWNDQRAADFHCFKQLLKRLEPVFLDDILTRVNYLDRSAGWGQPKDKQIFENQPLYRWRKFGFG